MGLKRKTVQIDDTPFQSASNKKRKAVTIPVSVQDDDLPPSGLEDDEDDDMIRGFDFQEGLNSEDSGDEEVAVEEESTTETRRQRRTSDSKNLKPLTGREIRAIKDASDLYQSRSFKLQIDELLPNIRPPTSLKSALDKFLLGLHTAISSVQATTSPHHPLSASRLLLEKGVAVPYPHPLPTEDTNWKVAYAPPEEITLVGSWATGTGVKKPNKTLWTADVAAEMPASLFQEKDNLNARFFHKRAYYLAHLAAGLSSKKAHKALGTPVEMVYESIGGDPRRTTLIIQVKKENAASDFANIAGVARVRIIPVLSPVSSPIPLHRLGPSQGNIRATPPPSDQSSSSGTAQSSAPVLQSRRPSPGYNAALIRSYTPRAHLLSAHTLCSAATAYADALALLRVWALQRGYGESGQGATARWCVAGFEGLGEWWAALLEVLIEGEEVASADGKGKKKKERKTVGRGLSSYQLFRAALDLLAKRSFVEEPVFVKSSKGHRFLPSDYNLSNRPIFVDSASLLNILVDVPPSSLGLLRRDARATLEVLDHSAPSVDPFKETFLKDHRNLTTRFDVVLRVDLSTAKLRTNSLHDVLDHGSPSRALYAAIPALLTRGLGDRVKSLAVLHLATQDRPLSQAHPSPHPSPSNDIFIGICLDTANAFRLVDHGPAADDPDKAGLEEFRAFWGQQSELRRFKDGRILESVVWNAVDADDRARIPERIVRFVLERHCGIVASRVTQEHSSGGEGGVELVTAYQAQFDRLLRVPPATAAVRVPTREGSAPGFRGAQLAFDGLVKALRSIEEGLNLSILGVSPSSPCLRYTSPLAPLPLSTSAASALGDRLPENARYLASIELVLQFEISAKWPDDVRAVQKIKLAFFERIANMLLSLPGSPGIGTYRAEVGVDDPRMAIASFGLQAESSLEILTPEGWAFRLRIWHEREAEMLDKISGSKKLPKHLALQVEPGEQRAALQAKEVYTRRFVHSPKHHRAVVDLNHRFPAYSGTVRLIKRWLASHWLLDGHVSEEAVELICASIFLRNRKTREEGQETEGIPASKERGFASVIELLSEWEWSTGLFIPLYGSDVEVDQESQVIAGIGKGVWRLSTEDDRAGTIWTKDSPQLVAAERVRAIAKATRTAQRAIENGALNVRLLFTHPDSDYDFIIHLDPTVLPRHFQSVAGSVHPEPTDKYANLRAGTAQDIRVRAGWDPAQLFLEDIKRIYADTCVVFFDILGGSQIGGVWVPGLTDERPFKVLAGYSSLPVSSSIKKAKGKLRDEVVLNQKAVLTEIERLGRGLVTSVSTKS